MNPRIETLTVESATASARATLEQIGKALGMVPNLHRTLAHAPAALDGYVKMAGALAGGKLAPKLREQIAVATAGFNGCEYCASAHTLLGKNAGVSGEEIACNLEARSNDPATAAVLTFTRKLLDRRGMVSDDDVATLRRAGFDDASIVEIIAHVGLNTFTNMFNNAVKTTIDFPVVKLAAAATGGAR